MVPDILRANYRLPIKPTSNTLIMMTEIIMKISVILVILLIIMMIIVKDNNNDNIIKIPKWSSKFLLGLFCITK